jgi:hypothetical protein
VSSAGSLHASPPNLPDSPGRCGSSDCFSASSVEAATGSSACPPAPSVLAAEASSGPESTSISTNARMRTGSKSSAAAACAVRVSRCASDARRAQEQAGVPSAARSSPHSGHPGTAGSLTHAPSTHRLHILDRLPPQNLHDLVEFETTSFEGQEAAIARRGGGRPRHSPESRPGTARRRRTRRPNTSSRVRDDGPTVRARRRLLWPKLATWVMGTRRSPGECPPAAEWRQRAPGNAGHLRTGRDGPIPRRWAGAPPSPCLV